MAWLRARYSPSRVLDYREAKGLMFSEIDRDASGMVEGLYSGNEVYIPGDLDSLDAAMAAFDTGAGYNAEHIYPQSKLKRARALWAVSDLHHIFPARVKPNAIRGNHSFTALAEDSVSIDGDGRALPPDPDPEPSPEPAAPTEDAAAQVKFDHLLTTDPHSSSYNTRGFTPRPEVKGDVARAVFYIQCIYGDKLRNPRNPNLSHSDRSFFPGMAGTLRRWHEADPVTEAELSRLG